MPKPGWIDVSVPLRSGMVRWPENPAVEVERVRDVATGASSTLSRLAMGSHAGTHVDAPVHFLPGAAGVDEVPLEALMGEARVIDIADPAAIHVAELQEKGIQRGERLLFRTRNSARGWPGLPFLEDAVYITPDAARWLATAGVRTVGIDYLSVGGYKKQGGETHLALLRAGVTIIEGLDLATVNPGKYDLVCLPLRVPGADGAPARALLRPRR